eukprot:SM000091S24602  [mRNA]  locus=s91:236478:236948:- [translate_table: standard]
MRKDRHARKQCVPQASALSWPVTLVDRSPLVAGTRGGPCRGSGAASGVRGGVALVSRSSPFSRQEVALSSRSSSSAREPASSVGGLPARKGPASPPVKRLRV